MILIVVEGGGISWLSMNRRAGKDMDATMGVEPRPEYACDANVCLLVEP